MRHRFLLLSAPPLALSLALLAAAPEARACGGCVVPPDESTQVTGHRMIFAVSKSQTTLYDQIEYAGDPESFAWFLPIHGQVDVGLSSDAMFAYLGNASQVVVSPPPITCINSFRGDVGLAAEDSAGGDQGVYVPAEEQVEVISQEVVGPYETVQLEAQSPGALVQWLTDHGYSVPEDVEPVIAAYQEEGFGFLAMKLVPGEGVTSMRPVRVTSPGGGLSLPLRMVAAGTGALTQVTLYVMSEGRYEVAGRPNVRIYEGELFWSWDDNISNYRFLRDDKLDATDGFGWLTESAQPFSRQSLINQVEQVIQVSPGTTGWGDPAAGVPELDDALADLDTLFAGMDEKSIWLTRMSARLSRPALAEDLVLGAAAEQEEVPRFLRAYKWTGSPPACPSGPGFWACALHPEGARDGEAALLLGTGLLAACSWSLRRRRRSPPGARPRA